MPHTVLVRERNPHTYGDDVRQMLERRLTFDEAIQNADFSLVSNDLAIVVLSLSARYLLTFKTQPPNTCSPFELDGHIHNFGDFAGDGPLRLLQPAIVTHA